MEEPQLQRTEVALRYKSVAQDSPFNLAAFPFLFVNNLPHSDAELVAQDSPFNLAALPVLFLGNPPLVFANLHDARTAKARFASAREFPRRKTKDVEKPQLQRTEVALRLFIGSVGGRRGLQRRRRYDYRLSLQGILPRAADWRLSGEGRSFPYPRISG